MIGEYLHFVLVFLSFHPERRPTTAFLEDVASGEEMLKLSSSSMLPPFQKVGLRLYEEKSVIIASQLPQPASISYTYWYTYQAEFFLEC